MQAEAPRTYGYARVSSTDQNLARQEDALKGAGVYFKNIVSDMASGKSTDREKLNTLRDVLLRSGDTLVVTSMDRLARNLRDLLDIVRDLSEKGVTVRFLKENLVFDGSPQANLFLGIFGSVAQFERALIRERQQEGINAAKARGTYKAGRREKLTDIDKTRMVELYDKGVRVVELAKQFEVSRPVVYKVLKDAQHA